MDLTLAVWMTFSDRGCPIRGRENRQRDIQTPMDVLNLLLEDRSEREDVKYAAKKNLTKRNY